MSGGFFTNIEYRIYCFCPARMAHRGGCRREPLASLDFFSVSVIFFNIEYLFYSFVLGGRRIEGLAGTKPLYELPRLLRLLLGLVFAYGSLGC